MKINFKLLLGLIIILLFFSCKKNNDSDKPKNSIKKAEHTHGNLEIAVDPSFKNLTNALANIYMADYPNVNITVKEEVEDKAISNFLNGKYPLIISSKPLTAEQKNFLENKTKINYIESPIAVDATVFIVAKENPISFIDEQDIRKNLYQESPSISFILDHPNSSNSNTVNDRLGLTLPKGKKIIAAGDPEKVIDYIKRNKNSIGIIGLNDLNEANKKHLEAIKVISVMTDQGDVYEPSNYNLRNGLYPFFRKIYILKNEIGFGIGAGFSRFAGSQRGQKIVTREHLQPYYLYKRTVQLK